MMGNKKKLMRVFIRKYDFDQRQKFLINGQLGR